MVKHTQTISRLSVTNCLSVCDHFLGLALKGLMIVATDFFSQEIFYFIVLFQNELEN